MLAGVLLGPSLFGLLWPEAQHWLFPWDTTQKMRDTQSYLFPASQLGLALYMFVVGMEFRVDIVQRQLKSSIAVSVAGMVTPFVLGAGAGLDSLSITLIYFQGTLRCSEAMLFLGASMCITAFPMLARIIHFKKLTGHSRWALWRWAQERSTMQRAWCLLAVVLASFDKNWNHALANIGGGVAYVAVTLLVVRPLLASCQELAGEGRHAQRAGLGYRTCRSWRLGAWFTDLIGLHAVFGAFVMGAAMPRGVVVRDLIGRIQPLTVALAASALFHLLGLEYEDWPAESRFPLANVWRGAGRGGAGQRRCVLAGRTRHRHSKSRSARHRHADECAGTDGTDHHQYRPATRDYFGRTFRHACDHGGCHYAHGFAAVRLPRWKRDASTRSRARG